MMMMMMIMTSAACMIMIRAGLIATGGPSGYGGHKNGPTVDNMIPPIPKEETAYVLIFPLRLLALFVPY